MLRIKEKHIITPVVFHSLKGYDSYLLMQAISKVKGTITCIPNNMEKYISFSLKRDVTKEGTQEGEKKPRALRLNSGSLAVPSSSWLP